MPNRQKKMVEWQRRVLNGLPAETSAWIKWQDARITKEPPKGVEPSACYLRNSCSNQLS